MEAEKLHIDQNILSRQLAVYGYEAQGKLMALRVYLHGLTGVSNIIFSWVFKLPKISYWLGQNRSQYMTLASSLSKMLVAIFTAGQNTLVKLHVLRHLFPNLKNLTPQFM